MCPKYSILSLKNLHSEGFNLKFALSSFSKNRSQLVQMFLRCFGENYDVIQVDDALLEM